MKRKKHGKNRKECRSYMRYSERNKCINTLEEQKEKRECKGNIKQIIAKNFPK